MNTGGARVRPELLVPQRKILVFMLSFIILGQGNVQLSRCKFRLGGHRLVKLLDNGRMHVEVRLVFDGEARNLRWRKVQGGSTIRVLPVKRA